MARVPIPDSARTVLDAGRLAHVVTLDIDGGPHVVCVWVKAEGDEVVLTAMSDRRRYIRNLRHDPRIAISIHTDHLSAGGLQEYLVIEGRAEITHGGGREKLAELAKIYLGPDAEFPLPDEPGWLIRVTPTNIGGVGPWHDA